MGAPGTSVTFRLRLLSESLRSFAGCFGKGSKRANLRVRERQKVARLSCSAYGSFLRFTARSNLIGNDRKGSEVAGRIVGWNVCLIRLRAQKQTDGHRPLSDLVPRAALGPLWVAGGRR
jgi:hypothetical protein